MKLIDWLIFFTLFNKWVSESASCSWRLKSMFFFLKKQHFLQVWLSNDMRMSGAAEVAGARNIVINNRKMPKFYQCPSCTFTSSNRSHFADHYRTHTGEKPFSCSYCSYQTGDRSNLKRHVRIHAKKSPSSLWDVGASHLYCHIQQILSLGIIDSKALQFHSCDE